MSTRDHPDWWKNIGGQNSQDSTLERRSMVWNDNDIEDGTDPPAFYTCKEFVGKFFPRGMRGMIERIEIYCRDAGADRIYLWWSPQPCLQVFGDCTITPLANWAWRGADIGKMWNYDSLFIWVYYCEPGTDWAYDTERPYDGHEGVHPLQTMSSLNIRPYIRVIYSGETPGDVPVSGIVNNIPIPSSSSFSQKNDYALPADNEIAILAEVAAGYCDYIEAVIDAAVNSHLTYIRVYVDEVLAMEEQPFVLNAHGHTTSTPTVSLSKYAEDGLCVILIHKRFEFRQRLSLRAYNLPSPQTVSFTMHPTTMR